MVEQSFHQTHDIENLNCPLFGSYSAPTMSFCFKNFMVTLPSFLCSLDVYNPLILSIFHSWLIATVVVWQSFCDALRSHIVHPPLFRRSSKAECSELMPPHCKVRICTNIICIIMPLVLSSIVIFTLVFNMISMMYILIPVHLLALLLVTLICLVTILFDSTLPHPPKSPSPPL